MAAGGSAQLFDVLDLPRSGHPDFFISLEKIEAQTPILPYTHAVRRAWEEMHLGGVLYVDRSPAAYFKEVPDITDTELRRLQRCLWNHGITPILVLVGPREVRVYSGRSLPAGDKERPDDADRLVRNLNRTSDVLEIRQLVQAIESGQLLSDYPKSFDRERSVDRYLLRNLAVVRDRLGAEPDGLGTPAIHGLLTRLLFACYLVEREIVVGDRLAADRLANLGPDHTVANLLKDVDPAEAKERLYLLFDKLKSRFNGSLFDVDLSVEKQSVNHKHMKIIQQFMAGGDLDNKQLTLGFWAYNFRVIPVETISAIYEDFIEAEGSSKQREAGAYYTPPHLAELIVDTALDGRPLLDTTVLDPACGSGVFLVSVFNRMALEWHRRNPNGRNKTKARELIRLLKNRVFGVDNNETACRIACFSLYLALLDQLDRRDIDALEEQGQKLPTLLLPKDETQLPDDPRSIVCGDFFDPDLRLARRDFDLVIGNPPWVSRGKATDAMFLQWQSHAPKILAPQRQMAHGFMWQAPKFLKDGGKACLLLPSAVLLNQTDAFQKAWFAGTCVQKVINLSDLRHLLFQGGKHPGVIMRFARAASSCGREPITYENPKVDVTSLLGGPVHILEQDVATIRPSEVLARAEAKEASMLWKTRFWGTPRDIRFLARLMDMPRLEKIVGKPREDKRWVCGQGFQEFNPEPGSNVEELRRKRKPKPRPWPSEQLFLDAKSKSVRLLVLETDCGRIGDRFQEIHRIRDPKIYQPPLVLVSQGGSKVAFADFHVVFQSSLQSVKGEPKDAGLLKFLAAVIDSDLATYFFFHTAANWGTERDKVHFFELLRLPFPLPEECNNPRRARAIIAQVEKKLDRLKKELQKLGGAFGRSERADKVRDEFEPLVREYYDVDPYEAMLIEDTVRVFEPSSTPASASTKVPTLQPASLDDRQEYAATVTGMLNTWASRAGFWVSATVAYSRSAGQAILTLSRGASARPYKESGAASDLRDAMKRVAAALPQANRGFVRFRGLKVFDGNQIHILKPLTLRSWTRTAALNDADEIAAAILSRGRGH